MPKETDNKNEVHLVACPCTKKTGEPEKDCIVCGGTGRGPLTMMGPYTPIKQ